MPVNQRITVRFDQDVLQILEKMALSEGAAVSTIIRRCVSSELLGEARREVIARLDRIEAAEGEINQRLDRIEKVLVGVDSVLKNV